MDLTENDYICLTCGQPQVFRNIPTDFTCNFCGGKYGKRVFYSDKYRDPDTNNWESFIMQEEMRKKYVLVTDNPYYDEDAYKARIEAYLKRKIACFSDEQKERYKNGEPLLKLLEEKESNRFTNRVISRSIEPELPRIKCPTCGSTKVSKIGTVERTASVLGLGLLSKKINKTFKCKDCGYTW